MKKVFYCVLMMVFIFTVAKISKCLQQNTEDCCKVINNNNAQAQVYESFVQNR